MVKHIHFNITKCESAKPIFAVQKCLEGAAGNAMHDSFLHQNIRCKINEKSKNIYKSYSQKVIELKKKQKSAIHEQMKLLKQAKFEDSKIESPSHFNFDCCSDTTQETHQGQQLPIHPIMNNVYELIRELGQGATSKVYLANHLLTGQLFAIKLIKFQGGYNRSKFEKEIQINNMVRHDNVIQLLQHGFNGFIQNPNGSVFYNQVFMVLEYCSGDTLFKLVKEDNQGRGFGEDAARVLMKQMVETISFFQESGISHCDLKLENILYDEQMNLKVADFGQAEYQNLNCLSGSRGTKCYMAPEIWNNQIYNGSQIDVFALGVLLNILVVGKMPFGRATLDDKYFKTLVNGNFERYFLSTGAYDFSNEYKDLLTKMLKYDSNERASLNEIKNHPWMNQTIHQFEQKQYLKSLVKMQNYQNYDQEYFCIDKI